MPGTLGLAEQAILGSTLPWTKHESDTGRIAWQAAGYRILSDGDNPRYWTATVRLDRDRVHLAAGAGDLGLSKCVRHCERHAAGHAAPQVQAGAAAPIQSAANRAVCAPTTSPVQQQELL